MSILRSALDCAGCIHHEFGPRRILVRSDNARELLNLIERVPINLPVVELVVMTFPESDHAANGLSVFVKSKNTNENLQWIPRRAANCVSKHRQMDDETWQRLLVDFGKSTHVRRVDENNAVQDGNQQMLLVLMWATTAGQVPNT